LHASLALLCNQDLLLAPL
jgi:hypothetical protein